MEVKLKVTSVTKLDVQADNNTVLDVAYDIVEVTPAPANPENPDAEATPTEAVVRSDRQSFPLDTSKEAMVEALTKVKDLYISEKAQSAANAELDAANAQADQVITEVSGLEI